MLQLVLKELLDNGFLHGDQITVSGKTMAENLADVQRLSEIGQQVHGASVFMSKTEDSAPTCGPYINN